MMMLLFLPYRHASTIPGRAAKVDKYLPIVVLFFFFSVVLMSSGKIKGSSPSLTFAISGVIEIETNAGDFPPPVEC